jgi:hypothetical protein
MKPTTRAQTVHAATILPAETTKNLVTLLQEEQSGAQLPGVLKSGVEDDAVPSKRKTTPCHQESEIYPAANDEVIVQDLAEGFETAAEEETAVVAATGKHGRRAKGQFLPAGVVGELPENGAE